MTASCGRLKAARSIQLMRLGGGCWYGVQEPSKHYVAGVHKAVRARPQAKAKPRPRPGASRRVPRLRPWDGAKRRAYIYLIDTLEHEDSKLRLQAGSAFVTT